MKDESFYRVHTYVVHTSAVHAVYMGDALRNVLVVSLEVYAQRYTLDLEVNTHL